MKTVEEVKTEINNLNQILNQLNEASMDERYQEAKKSEVRNQQGQLVQFDMFANESDLEETLGDCRKKGGSDVLIFAMHPQEFRETRITITIHREKEEQND